MFHKLIRCDFPDYRIQMVNAFHLWKKCCQKIRIARHSSRRQNNSQTKSMFFFCWLTCVHNCKLDVSKFELHLENTKEVKDESTPKDNANTCAYTEFDKTCPPEHVCLHQSLLVPIIIASIVVVVVIFIVKWIIWSHCVSTVWQCHRNALLLYTLSGRFSRTHCQSKQNLSYALCRCVSLTHFQCAAANTPLYMTSFVYGTTRKKMQSALFLLCDHKFFTNRLYDWQKIRPN